jgi:hypothetical protein
MYSQTILSTSCSVFAGSDEGTDEGSDGAEEDGDDVIVTEDPGNAIFTFSSILELDVDAVDLLMGKSIC